MNDEVLNIGLHFAMEFGPNLNQPINSRLKEKFSELTEAELDSVNKICYKVRDEGNNFVMSTLDKAASKRQKISPQQLEIEIATFIHSKYLWVSAENLARIYSQGCYYAWKDGLIEALGE